MTVWSPYEVLMPLAPWEEPAVLAQALATLAAQQPAPQRLVLGVDGPMPEGFQQVVQEQAVAGLPILVLPGPGGEGVGVVLARGLAACACELILRADADDLSRHDRAARQLAWLAQHPEVVAGSGWIEEFVANPAHGVVGCRRVPLDGAVARWARWRNPLNHPAVVLRRSAVLAVGGYRHQPGFEDYDLWLRLLRRFGPQALNNLPAVLVAARVGPAHLARRRGWGYARQEAQFLLRSAREGQLGWGQALLLLLLRLPWRLLPAPFLEVLMTRLRQVVA
ncbi:glycosyltransferase [Synechococcus sp. CS-1330]|nr:glycosyltransferase [Synechococcus sp. CS-1330]